jgi:hypothetical protein
MRFRYLNNSPASPKALCLVFSLVAISGAILPADSAAQPVAPNRLPAPPANQPLLPGQRWTPPPSPAPAQPLLPVLIPALFPLFMAPFLVLVVIQQHRAQREQHAEEEDRTNYTEEDMMQEYEFKILRCRPPSSFARRDFLCKVLAEEAAAGWQMVELFDGQRLRLKRPKSGSSADASLAELPDPYRLQVADLDKRARAIHQLWWLPCVACLVAVVVGIGGLIVDRNATVPAAIVASVAGVLMLVFGWLALRRRAG